MIKVGNYNTLTVVKEVDFGMYLDGDPDEILLPLRYVPEGLQPGDTVEVFIYHDNEGRLIATTLRPVATVGEIALMEVGDTNDYGAFLKWGLMKDVFLPLSLMKDKARIGDEKLVYLFIDERTGRVTATERIEQYLSNREITLTEKEPVDLVIFRKTEIGYMVIINNKHLGLIHYNEVFRELHIGEKIKGFIKQIRQDNKIDVVPGLPGYTRVKNEEEGILELLRGNAGYLPYNDKSKPDDIYSFFGMSKKTFKMTIGGLYKKHLIEITANGIKLAE